MINLPKFGDDFFNRVEKKTNVNKETIVNLARKLQGGNMKDEGVLREVIHEISEITGKDVSKEKEQKIIDSILNDKIPKDMDKYI